MERIQQQLRQSLEIWSSDLAGIAEQGELDYHRLLRRITDVMMIHDDLRVERGEEPEFKAYFEHRDREAEK